VAPSWRLGGTAPPAAKTESSQIRLSASIRRMSTKALKDTSPFAGHSPDQERPLGGYAALMALFSGLCGAFLVWLRRSDRERPITIGGADLALMAVATHKSSRLIAKSRATSTLRAPFTRFQDDAGAGEVDEAARGRGLRRAIGELLVCPHCLGLWVAAAFGAGMVAAPRPTRWIALVFTAMWGADVLHIARRRSRDGL
jgi:hypothetical protein